MRSSKYFRMIFTFHLVWLFCVVEYGLFLHQIISFLFWDKVFSILRQGFHLPCHIFFIVFPVTVLEFLRSGLSFPQIWSSSFLRYHLHFPSNMVWTFPQLWSSSFFRYGFNISSDMVLIYPQMWLSSCLWFELYFSSNILFTFSQRYSSWFLCFLLMNNS
jgi:hypothetical protein